MDETTLQRRLLLCLFGLGTNTGIKSMESRPDDNHKDLYYIRRRFLSVEGLRQATTQVLNATLAARLPRIWGEATTACASDSKQFGAWDHNLQTTVTFAFCHLLGFDLMPPIKDISRQKLSKAEVGQVFANLEPVMASRVINWELIEEYYDAMVKHAVALKLGMADAESLLRRFTRNNIQHPLYKALMEPGKVVKTIFLCRYLASEGQRREVHEGLNVVESWNSTKGFIFYGKAGELATNHRENQEIGLLCLHLLQASLVYINTLMIQEVLGDLEWLERMTNRDLAALSPLLTQQINPYGRFELDMKTRIALAS
jgi:TnpA family transposase